ncbi:MAG: SAM-dependent methyltransferase [Streptosporangiaceae bacterium]
MLPSSKSRTMPGYDNATPFAANSRDSATVPRVAGIYDTLLGGKDCSAIDQQAAGELLRLVPDAVMAAYQHRRFVQLATRFLARDAGIRQFVDIGISLDRLGGMYDIVQQATPDARVLYIDSDPAVVSRAQDRLTDNLHTLAIRHDLRDPDGLVNHPAFQELIDPAEQVAILLAGVLHFVGNDGDAARSVSVLTRAAAAGSYLALSHATADDLDPEVSQRVRGLYENSTAPFTPRSYADVVRFFKDLDILPPGVVAGPTWRAGWFAPDPRRTLFYAGLAQKRRGRGEFG